MLDKIRKILIQNRAYILMVLFIAAIQLWPLMPSKDSGQTVTTGLSAQEFNREAQARQELWQERVKKDKKLANNIAIVSMLLLGLFTAGTVFLIVYIKDRSRRGQYIPHTLDGPPALWSVSDVVRVVILIVFLHGLVSLVSYRIAVLSGFFWVDRRLDTVLSTIFMNMLIFLFVLRVVKDRYRQGIDSLGLSLMNVSRDIRTGLFSYMVFLPILVVTFLGMIAIAAFFHYTPPPQPVYELVFKEQRPFVLAASFFLITLFGPFTEEVFFRGFLYGALRKSIGVLWAAVLSGLLFSLLHTNLMGFIPIMIFGIFLAYIREKTGSLVPSVIVHIAHNTILFGMMFFVREITSKAA
jgi:uncharacterized protein